MNLVGRLHGGMVHPRRVRVLAAHLAPLIPSGARVLDVGCGDGLLAGLIQRHRPDTQIHGVDIAVRQRVGVPVTPFDGKTLPFASGSFATVMLIDMLHHTDDPEILLREAKRVAVSTVLLKDHLPEGLLARPTLRLMDWVGNAPHGVALPYNYWAHPQWLAAFEKLALKVTFWKRDLRLYPLPADWIFGRKLHFLARLEISP